jgi:hypothetical protein
VGGLVISVAGVLTVIELALSRRDAAKLGAADTWDAVAKLGPTLQRALQASRWRVLGVVLLVLGVMMTSIASVWACTWRL